MRRSLARPAWAIAFALACASCGHDAPPPPLTASMSGTLEVVGLQAPVRIVRDRWGVPHVYAESRDDVFMGQGFVQAEDRLFQMEVWRRSAEGKLAEVLGANFIERDAMTRRLQYQSDLGGRDVEWASYGPDARPSAEAFVRGVNAWVALARERPPELFVVSGWRPVFWAASDLLNRTDAFDRQGTINDAEKRGLPGPVVDAVKRAAVPAFFVGLAGPVRAPAFSPRSAAPTASEPGAARTYSAPSTRYLIHLHTPHWNAIGATFPWRPGLMVGHDGFASWDRPEPALRAIVRGVPFDPSAGRIVKDRIAVRGRSEPFEFSTQITPTGVVVATDRAGGRQFTLDWDGFKPGTAPAFASASASRRDATVAEDLARPSSRVVFQHLLAISPAARARFNVSVAGSTTPGPPFRFDPDSRVWDASRAINAPGQSEDPDSPHFADLAALWAAGQTFTLAFSDGAVTANAVTTLTLVPASRR